MNKRLIVLLLLLFCASSLFGYDAPQVDVLNLRSKAMGNVRLGVIDDQYSILNNPAGPALLNTKWISIVQAHAVLTGDLLDLYNNRDKYEPIIKGEEDIDNDTYNMLANLKLGAGTTPVYLAMINILPFNLSFAVFNTTSIKMTSNRDIPIPTWNMDVFNDTVAMVNFSMNLVDFKFMNIYLGANVKAVHRLMFSKQRMDLFYLYDLQNMNPDTFDVYKAWGIGADIGAIAEVGRSRRLRVAATVTDFFNTRFSWDKLDNPDDPFGSTTPAGEAEIKPSLNLGVAYKLGTIVPTFVENVIIAGDMRGIFDFDIPTFMKLYVGVEFSMINFIKFRMGFNRGWFTGGIGFDFPIFELDFAYWGEELGNYPGQSRQDNLGFTFNFVF